MALSGQSDAIAEMSVMDVVELVAAMEEKFGVTAAAAVAAAPVAAAGGDAGAAEEKTDFDACWRPPAKKVNVIKVVRGIRAWPQAKALADGASPLKEGASKDEAEDIKKQVEEAEHGRDQRPCLYAVRRAKAGGPGVTGLFLLQDPSMKDSSC